MYPVYSSRPTQTSLSRYLNRLPVKLINNKTPASYYKSLFSCLSLIKPYLLFIDLNETISQIAWLLLNHQNLS